MIQGTLLKTTRALPNGIYRFWIINTEVVVDPKDAGWRLAIFAKKDKCAFANPNHEDRKLEFDIPLGSQIALIRETAIKDYESLCFACGLPVATNQGDHHSLRGKTFVAEVSDEDGNYNLIRRYLAYIDNGRN